LKRIRYVPQVKGPSGGEGRKGEILQGLPFGGGKLDLGAIKETKDETIVLYGKRWFSQGVKGLCLMISQRSPTRGDPKCSIRPEGKIRAGGNEGKKRGTEKKGKKMGLQVLVRSSPQMI